MGKSINFCSFVNWSFEAISLSTLRSLCFFRYTLLDAFKLFKIFLTHAFWLTVKLKNLSFFKSIISNLWISVK